MTELEIDPQRAAETWERHRIVSIFEPKAATALVHFVWVLVGGQMDMIDVESLPDATQYRALAATNNQGGSFMAGVFNWVRSL